MQLVQCDECGELFGMTARYHRELLDSGKVFFCPNGHRLQLRPVAELQKKVARLEDDVEIYRVGFLQRGRELEKAHSRTGGYKSQWLKQKKLADNLHWALGGVCLVCQRRVRSELAERGIKYNERPR